MKKSLSIQMFVGALFFANGPIEPLAKADSKYEEDVAYALDVVEEKCGHFFEKKKIDWESVRSDFAEQATKVTSDQEHLVLLVRLVARLKDGHASVRPLQKGEDVKWPEQPEETGLGMFWCQTGKALHIKNVWGSAKSSGAEPGMEILKVGGMPAREWLTGRIATLSDLISFSTRQQAFFYATHWGLRDEVGTKLTLEVKTPRGRTKGLRLKYQRANQVPSGPAFFPEAKGEFGRAGRGDLNWCVMKDGGWGYIHVRRCKGNLPEMMDEALAAVGDARGIILDWRGNSGGGFDHDALLGRFVPAGKTIAFVKRYRSAGPKPYVGPVVAIIDATVRSAGETGAGIFKEDGRAYMIGESATAGMSSGKTTIKLPSELFSLYVSVSSNKGRFNGREGIEGIGVRPHEFVRFDPKDLANEQDTLIKRAAAILKGGIPKGKVPYEPSEFGWK